jgi:uncharacterized membrane protein YdcZ (DUF606 family)
MGSALVVAAVIGAAIAIQVGIVGRTGERFNLLAISTVLQVGGVTAGIVWLAVRSGWGEVAAIARLWWWFPLGVVGWLLVAGLGFASARVGVATALAIAVTTQLSVGLAIDSGAGLRVGAQSLLGLVLLVAGTVLVTTRP